MEPRDKEVEASKRKITYKVDLPFFIIKLNSPETLNCMTSHDYIYLCTLLQMAEENKEVYFTVLQSSGRFFSSGADFRFISKHKDFLDSKESKFRDAHEDPAKVSELNKIWLDAFVSRNLFVTDAFINHSKILIACMNGPVVGLTAALCLLCDLVYSMNDKVYFQCPFAKLGLVCEGGTSVTLPLKLGYNLSFEKLMFSENIEFNDLKDRVIVKNYQMQDTEKFNEIVLKDLKNKISKVYLPSCLAMKKILNNNINSDLERANSREVNVALPYWVRGEPVRRFQALLLGKRNSRL
ncbi:dodecenoyl-CoA isomerase NDAI_0I01910 [Naumovozyma dairenensis CBS 421]|uniref:3-hydroxyisobutyryl-coenzyme A hydrolase n=1 Tax=Naumovozyma dairenensis (strain ATCC 10597 / BCRC 20456 / CBS 421 / NBRC 0211 / NRRL Y-12639) TaxID=1071378 RepID=G0WG49_NAUDC|nr:hypothetical protein NDAI_0I01910 [Naumovozyma dairenensis CBS 421]CCD26760.1 hypothetical protein NDAI_0I01910 [Naumovozyma dairenensis CBS 421]